MGRNGDGGEKKKIPVERRQNPSKKHLTLPTGDLRERVLNGRSPRQKRKFRRKGKKWEGTEIKRPRKKNRESESREALVLKTREVLKKKKMRCKS